MAEEASEAVAISPKWTRPDEVMKFHRLKLKKRQLQARMMNKTDIPTSSISQEIGFSSIDTESYTSLTQNDSENIKRKNPFRCNFKKRSKEAEPESECYLESASDDNTLFNLLNINNAPKDDNSQRTSFTSILSQISRDSQKAPEPVKKGNEFIPLDWTLKTKLRFTSHKPFAWNATLRTCEEASGITGFVRCMPTDADSSIDTSPNARFHQCCLVWQHPSLPWLTLFPRSSGKVSDGNVIGSDPKLRAALFKEFTESFRSLYQLVRARQCPYFYICANAFTCLFRAAGVCGISDIHVLLTPTTRGLRQTLREEDVNFTMPLSKKSRTSNGESGVESQSQPASLDGTQPSDGPAQDEEDEDDDEDDTWLESMGVAPDEIKRLNKKQAKMVFDKEREVDRTPESLVYIEGTEVQSMYNFLMNCKSIVTLTGPNAGVTPTLLAPVAFHGAALKSLKVRQSLVKVESNTFHSIELKGPILPHTVHNLCGLLDKSLDEFSATFINLESTRPFSLAAHSTLEPKPATKADCSPSKPLIPTVFNSSSLCDCGLEPRVIERLCSDDMSRVQVIDSVKYNKDKTYSWY